MEQSLENIHHGGGKTQKYILTLEDKQFFIETYDGTGAAIDKIQDRLRWPRPIIINLAVSYGLSRPKESPWTFNDLSYLYAHRDMSVRELAEHLHRSRISVKIRLMRLPDADGLYSQSQLCYFLGCSWRDIRKWIDAGWLHVSHREVNPGDVENVFARDDVRAFILAHGREISSPRRVDVHWLVDLLSSH